MIIFHWMGISIQQCNLYNYRSPTWIILFTGRGWCCPGGYREEGVPWRRGTLWRGYHEGGGGSMKQVPCKGDSVKGVSLKGGSLKGFHQRGVPWRGFHESGDSVKKGRAIKDSPLLVNKRAVHTLLEWFLVCSSKCRRNQLRHIEIQSKLVSF